MVELRTLLRSAGGVTLVFAATQAQAQEEGGETSRPQGAVVETQQSAAPAQTTTTTTRIQGYGLPAPGTDLNPGLPSSSKPITDTSSSQDGFDFGTGRGGGAATVHGRKDAPGVISRAAPAPRVHTVKRGDTLWDLCSKYYKNPWRWPQVWAYNPQIQNPHWIYPGDEVRMRVDTPGSRAGALASHGFIDRSSLVPPETVFLRNQGYIGDPKRDVWGTLVGAKEDQMLLSQGNNVYLRLREGANVQVGQNLTVFRRVRQPRKVKGARQPPGEIVSVKGTVRVDHWNPKTRVARGTLVESVDVVERGAKVGPVGRRFDVIPPRANTVDLRARVLTSIYPHVFMGQHQIAFIDRGSEDGLVPGNRLFVVRRGDTWRRSLKYTTRMGRDRLRQDVPEDVEVEPTPLEGRDSEFPEEIVAELRVVRTEKYSSLTIVTEAQREIVSGDRAIARKGY